MKNQNDNAALAAAPASQAGAFPPVPGSVPLDDPANPWRSMDRAPKDASWVEVKVCFRPYGVPEYTDPNQYPAKVYRAHWAQDLSGEEQPPFRGWFEANLSEDGRVLGHREIPAPYAWRPITQNTKVCDADQRE